MKRHPWSWNRAPFASQYRRQDPPRRDHRARRRDDLPHLGADRVGCLCRSARSTDWNVEDEAFRLVNNGSGFWSGFVPNAR